MKFFRSFSHQRKNVTDEAYSRMKIENEILYQENENYFRSVYALPDYRLSIYMKSGSIIHCDFRSKLNIPEFRILQDKELFRSVHTDGHRLIFSKPGMEVVEITIKKFMDIILYDNSKSSQGQ